MNQYYAITARPSFSTLSNGTGRFLGMIECQADYVLCHSHSSQRPTYTQLDPEERPGLAKLIRIYSRDRMSVTEEAKQRKVEIEGVLGSCRTFEQLASAWPDVMPIANEFRPVQKPKPQLPALVSKDLSAALDLPPERLAA